MTEYTLVSVDVETTGPSPATGELVSIGAVFLDEDYHIADGGGFSVNLEFPMVPKMHEDTLEWWKQYPEQWAEARKNCMRVKDAMWHFRAWLGTVGEKPLFVAWPVGFDWGFINHYLHLHTGANPFGYSPLCLKNYAAGVLRNPSMLMGSREEAFMPPGWLVTPEELGLMPHIALNDATAQAVMIRNIMLWTG